MANLSFLRRIRVLVPVAVIVLLSAGCSSSSAPSPSASDTAAPACSTPAIPAQSGPVCGFQPSGADSATAYLGIPFARPPVGDLRWTSPQSVERWSGVRTATQFASSCPSPNAPAAGFSGSEDCLYLNVWTPPTPAQEPRAVLVYIPGGGFIVGGASIPTYDGTAMANSGDVVVVNLNYRLGALGYMRYIENGAAIEGNFGIQDQVAALKWVQENISAFGGDPSKVTVMGESAGAVSAGLHLFSIPESNNLMRAAIMDSNISTPPMPNAATAAKAGKEFVSKQVCVAAGTTTSQGPCPGTAQWLRSLPLETVMTAANTQIPPGGLAGLFLAAPTSISWSPIEGVSPIAGQQLNGFGEGNSPKPYVMGHNRDEGDFFLPSTQVTSGPTTQLTTDQYTAWLKGMFPPNGTSASQILDFKVGGTRPYNPASYVESPATQMSPAAQAYARVVTDGMIAASNIYTGQLTRQQMKATGHQAFGYRFDAVASNFNYQGPDVVQCSPQSKNVCHSYELPFVFSNLYQRVQGGGFEKVEGTPEENTLAAAMTAAWTGFARQPTSAGWGHPAIDDPVKGPYVTWDYTVSTTDDVGKSANFEFWKPIIRQQLAQATAE